MKYMASSLDISILDGLLAASGGTNTSATGLSNPELLLEEVISKSFHGTVVVKTKIDQAIFFHFCTMSGPTRDGTAEYNSQDQILQRERG